MALCSSNNSSGVEEICLYKASVYGVVCPVILGLCLMALLANVMVLLSVRWISTPLTPTLRLTISLAACDSWTSFLVLVSLVHNSYLFFVLKITTSACVALAVEIFRTGGLIAGTLHLLALSFNHYTSIAHPFYYRQLFSTRSTLITIFVIWLVPPVALFIYSSSLHGEGFQAENCFPHHFYNALGFRLMIFLILTCCFLLMSMLYIHILVILRRLRRALTETCENPTQLKRERRMLITTLLILLTFLVGWFPASLHFLLTCSKCPLTALGRSMDIVKAVVGFSIVQLCFIMLKTLVNPVIYAIRIPEIKEQMQRFWRAWCRSPERQNFSKRSRVQKKDVEDICVRNNFLTSERGNRVDKTQPFLEEKPLVHVEDLV